VRVHLLRERVTRSRPAVLPAGSEDDRKRERATLPRAACRPAAL